MNERIKELAEQNGFIHRWMSPGEQHDLLQRYEKFAELIVRECIDWCNAHASIDGTAQKIVESIKKDFGVE